VTVKHIDKKTGQKMANQLTERIRDGISGVRVLGPGEPMISKIRNQYLMNILIKIPRSNGNLVSIKGKIQAAIGVLLKEKEYRNSRVIVDVDPV
jgi:primosomal protein N' (replication factor Y)